MGFRLIVAFLFYSDFALFLEKCIAHRKLFSPKAALVKINFLTIAVKIIFLRLYKILVKSPRMNFHLTYKRKVLLTK
mgnify:CR=1 FL=1